MDSQANQTALVWVLELQQGLQASSVLTWDLEIWTPLLVLEGR